jgi:hypothetical protein
MSVTVVNDHYFKRDGDIAEGKAAAAELVEYFKAHFPEVQLSLWLEGSENPLHHYHITVFDSAEVIQKLRESEGIKRFIGRLYPHIDHSSFISPLCDVWLADGKGIAPVRWKP